MIKSVAHGAVLAGILYLSVTYLDSVSLEVGPRGFAYSFGLLVILFVVVELVIHPVIRLVLLPIRFITFGIASVVLCVGLVYGVTLLYPPFTITSPFSMLLLAAAFAILQKVMR